MICPHCSASNPADQLYCGRCGSSLSQTASGYDTLDRIGSVLHDKYRLRSLIGIGAAGAVYRAEMESLGTTVAVKVLHPNVSADENARRRLENEARLASRIDHPNIVSILDMHSSPGLTFLVMEYLSGISLDEVLAEVGHLGVRRAIHIVRQLLSALEVSHAIGVLHRDLKPDNVYITLRHDQLDFVKVLDFGMATLTHGADTSRITVDGHVCGTPGYMSPEQARNRELAVSSDLYAVGVILYECLTGHNPFIGESAVETMVNQISHTPAVPSQVRPDGEIPIYLDALVMRALSKDPSQRFESALEFRTILESFVLTQGMPEVRTGPLTCAECGNVLAEGMAHCDACGSPVVAPQIDVGGLGGSMAPEAIAATDSAELEQADAELSLTLTTSIKAYQAVGWDPMLVGRNEELARIDALLGADGPPHRLRLMRILGGDGMGKGRLAREAAKRANARGYPVIWIEPELDPSFAGLYPIQQAVEKLLSAPAGARDREGLLRAAGKAGFHDEHLEGLYDLFGLSERDPRREVAKERRVRRALAWREAVRCGARRGPVLLVFQDMHLFDEPSRELVATLVSKKQLLPAPVAAVVTHDPQMLLLWPQTETMTVHPLSVDEAKMLVAILFDHVGLQSDVAPLIEASGGVPLMVIELVRLAAIDPSITPPRSLAETINQRIGRLPARTRTLLHTMAVLGRPTRADTLVTMLGEEPEAEHHALNFLAEQGFLLGTGSGWRPSHHLHRAVAYASTPAALRQQLHQRAAELALAADDLSALIAHHLYHAGDLERAMPFVLRAAYDALYGLDDQLAIKRFNRVLRHIPEPPQEFQGERKTWARAVLGMSQALVDGGDAAAALRFLKQASARADRAGWAEQRDRCDRRLVRLRELSQQPRS